MSALNPANTAYGQAAQRLEMIWSSGWEQRAEAFQDAYLDAIKLLNQAHLRELSRHTTEARIETAAAVLYDARYNPSFLRGVSDVNTWESAQDWIKAIYRKDAAAMLAAVDRLEDQ